MREFRSTLIALPLVLSCAAGSAAQQTPSAVPVAEELIAQERMRSAVEQALALYRTPTDNGDEQNDNLVRAADDLVQVGPGVVPFLAAELEQILPESYFFAAYALGRLGTPEAAAALRGAIERADQEPGDYPLTRKSWAIYGLGLAGESDAIRLLYEGRHRTGLLPIHSGTTVLEAVALQTQPDSVPRLLELVDRFAGDDDLRPERSAALRALWRLADPAAVPTLRKVMTEEDRHMRQEAARALACIRTPQALEAALAALNDPASRVRRLTAISLDRGQAEFDPGLVLERLEVEEDARARAPLFDLLVERLGTPAIPWMQDHWDDASAEDRLAMMAALERLPSPQALPLLERGLRDPDVLVVTRAVSTLGAIGGGEAVKRLRLAIHSPSWSVVRAAVEQLVRMREYGAADTISERLLKVELYRVVRQAEQRYRPELLAEALVSLRYTKALEGLKRATGKQVDPALIESLRRVVDQLEALKANGNDRDRWIEATRSPRREIRVLAYQRLAEIGGEAAAQTLAGAFGRVEADEGLELLRALGELNEAPVLDLLDRVLTGPEFDRVERLALRDMAAWSARRIGGERMSAALRAAVERRDGRDAKVLVYLLMLDGKRALPTLERYRLPRMHYLKWTRGKELEALDRIGRAITAGRSLARFDLPPEDLEFR